MLLLEYAAMMMRAPLMLRLSCRRLLHATVAAIITCYYAAIKGD